MAREAVLIHRRRRGIVEDDKIGRRAGLERTEQRLAENMSGEMRSVCNAGERPAGTDRVVFLASLSTKSRMNGATCGPSWPTRARPIELFMFERALWAMVAFAA